MRFLIILCLTWPALSQDGFEFSRYDNGLIYQEESMMALRQLVVSEGRNFFACPTESTYQSKQYILTDFVVLEAGEHDSLEIQKLLEKGKEANDLVASFASRVVFFFEDVPVIRYRGHSNKEAWFWREAVLGERIDVAELSAGKAHVIGPKKFYELRRKEAIILLFPKSPPTNMDLDPKYTRMVDYVDCMVGTTPINPGNIHEDDLTTAKDEENPITRFQDFLDFPNSPQIDWGKANEAEIQRYYQASEEWINARKTWIQETRSKDPRFLTLLEEAVAFAAKNGGGTEEMEDWSLALLSKEQTLEAMRSREVIGRCSMDQSPRIHAKRIAKLAAETAEWEIFLRAHLNILNDRFDRASDGSYAFEQRMTYFRELEALGLDLPMLIPGLALSVADPGLHHYFGSPMRLGRALVEADDPEPILDELVTMLTDPLLDPPNQWQVNFVLINYITHHEKEAGRQALEAMMESYPHLPNAFRDMAAFFITD